MIIIIEGCDNTGKSTLAKKLAERVNGKVFHCEKPKTDDVLQEYYDMLKQANFEAAREAKNHVIFDRCYLGEFVYSTLWRKGGTISYGGYSVLDREASRYGAVLIHATADTKDITERCIRNDEKLLDVKDIEKCKLLFDHIVDWCTLPKFKYNSSVIDADDFATVFLNSLGL